MVVWVFCLCKQNKQYDEVGNPTMDGVYKQAKMQNNTANKMPVIKL